MNELNRVLREREKLQSKIIKAVIDVRDRERAMHLILNWVPLDVLRDINIQFLTAVEDREAE